MGAVVKMADRRKQSGPWAELGFETEREMLVHDLKTVTARIESPATQGSAISGLMNQKAALIKQIRDLDTPKDGKAGSTRATIELVPFDPDAI